ncbi:hypothetical protein NT01EI_1467 [Edwardsiella ictaluri 93-146]|uniref:Uncharacterized protein n=2 Tax=Edwardsiella ictaluri TaxID=67780 RepID=C5BFD6_EDWI9|nr:hypothetical protein [Edwardsiella ictaluri]ACR68653.1 hypothetical protein NT01EI_1467 [Edwardsiella ictaluri 93-146]
MAQATEQPAAGGVNRHRQAGADTRLPPLSSPRWNLRGLQHNRRDRRRHGSTNKTGHPKVA